jgi:hypothetical protein
MVCLLIRHYNNPSNIQIIGYPLVDWKSNPDCSGPLRNYVAYLSARITHVVNARAVLRKAIASFYKDNGKGNKKQRRGTEDEPEDQDEFQLVYLFGWPTRRSDRFF